VLVLTIFIFHLIFSYLAFIVIPAMKPTVFAINFYINFFKLEFFPIL